jgi:hypothetical protein
MNSQARPDPQPAREEKVPLTTVDTSVLKSTLSPHKRDELIKAIAEMLTLHIISAMGNPEAIIWGY